MQHVSIAVFLSASQGFLAVALGAFGAHAVKSRISPQMLDVWQTAVHYQFFHAVTLFALALYWRDTAMSVWWQTGFWAFCIGILLFCGSLYWLALGGPRWLGPVTPLGGTAFLIGWLCLMVGALVK